MFLLWEQQQVEKKSTSQRLRLHPSNIYTAHNRAGLPVRGVLIFGIGQLSERILIILIESSQDGFRRSDRFVTCDRKAGVAMENTGNVEMSQR